MYLGILPKHRTFSYFSMFHLYFVVGPIAFVTFTILSTPGYFLFTVLKDDKDCSHCYQLNTVVSEWTTFAQFMMGTSMLVMVTIDIYTILFQQIRYHSRKGKLITFNA